MLAVYIDVCIVIAKTKKLINPAIMELSTNFKITDEWELDKYLRVKFKIPNERRVNMSQPFLIEQILSGI